MWARRSLLCSETHTGTWSSPRMSVPPIISGTTRGSFLCSVCWVCFLCKSGTRVQLCPHHRHPPGRSWNLLPTLQPPEPASAPPAFSHPGLADPPLLSRAGASILPRAAPPGPTLQKDKEHSQPTLHSPKTVHPFRSQGAPLPVPHKELQQFLVTLPVCGAPRVAGVGKPGREGRDRASWFSGGRSV